MAEKNPYEHLLDQITDLLELVNKNKGQAEGEQELPENIESELDVLEQHVALFKQSTEEALKKSGEDPEAIANVQDLPRKQKRFIQRARRIRKDLVRVEKENAAYKTVAKMQKKRKSKKQAAKARKKKFKRLSGGDKGWMPL